MTQLVCPLCGRFVSLNYFDPSAFDPDIYAVEVTGLGRGKGVKVSAQYSILKPGDATIKLIKDRILELSKALLDSGCLKPSEVLSSLKIKTASPQEAHKLKNEVETLAVKLEDARRLNTELKRELSRKGSEVETLEAELEDLKERCKTAFIQLKEKGEKLSGLYEEVSNMINMVEDALATGDEIWAWNVDEDEDPLEALKERLKDLIDEYEALAAEEEQYE